MSFGKIGKNTLKTIKIAAFNHYKWYELPFLLPKKWLFVILPIYSYPRELNLWC